MSFTRIHVICEGQTEATFVRELLVPVFVPRKIQLLPAILGKPDHKGGNVTFARILIDIKNRLRQELQAYCTTFIDYYGIHPEFPGKREASKLGSAGQRYTVMNHALFEAVQQQLNDDACRFIPHVQMHEFEALLFSEPGVFACEVCQPHLGERFKSIKEEFQTPEDINDSRETSPSHRILNLYPQYDKVNDGTIAALEIGLMRIRKECPCFSSWVASLEAL